MKRIINYVFILTDIVRILFMSCIMLEKMADAFFLESNTFYFLSSDLTTVGLYLLTLSDMGSSTPILSQHPIKRKEPLV